MELSDDSLTCNDVDECEVDSPCSHICENTEKRLAFEYFFERVHLPLSYLPVSCASVQKASFSPMMRERVAARVD